MLRYRLAGARVRRGAARATGRAINRGATRNMVGENKVHKGSEQENEKVSWPMMTRGSKSSDCPRICISKRKEQELARHSRHVHILSYPKQWCVGIRNRKYWTLIFSRHSLIT